MEPQSASLCFQMSESIDKHLMDELRPIAPLIFISDPLRDNSNYKAKMRQENKLQSQRDVSLDLSRAAFGFVSRQCYS